MNEVFTFRSLLLSLMCWKRYASFAVVYAHLGGNVYFFYKKMYWNVQSLHWNPAISYLRFSTLSCTYFKADMYKIRLEKLHLVAAWAALYLIAGDFVRWFINKFSRPRLVKVVSHMSIISAIAWSCSYPMLNIDVGTSLTGSLISNS